MICGKAPVAVKIIAIGYGFAAALNKMAVNGEEFRYSARPSALDTGSVHAVLGGINAAAKFEIRKFVPVWLLQRPTAVEKLCRRK